ncbi:MAG: hypothetical protein HY717_11350 [Planctomycetes bacterium]|nr:hypothetical protein [Planctomycetota bacterium]
MVLLAVLSPRGNPAFSGGGGRPLASRNGDANCDGRINISDAIHLIRWLFQGGEPPCAFANDPADLTPVIEALRDLKAQAASCCPRWPPKPGDIVNINQNQTGRESDQVLFTVPKDRWLVLTDFMIISGGDPEREMVYDFIEVIEEWKDEQTVKLDLGLSIGRNEVKNFQFNSATGIVFKPESTILLKARGLFLPDFNFIGYLASP